ncbi:hypothetical protein HQ590_04010, partial [bacterium]|nr:hypothetical protein [bacterium]
MTEGPRQPAIAATASVTGAGPAPGATRWATLICHAALPAVLLVLVAVAIQVVPGYRYQMNPDGVGYLSVANKYLHGHFRAAVSGYWSPLYSWLLVPLLALGITPLLATKVLAVILGGVGIGAVWRILIHLGVPTGLRLLTGLILVPVVLWFGMNVTTPDLLVCGVILLYLGEVTHPRWLATRAGAVRTGLWAALAYLGKAYALPFVLCHYLFVGTTAVIRQRATWRQLVPQLALGLGVCLVLSLPWAITLSLKFHRPMYGSTGYLNHAWTGPKSEGSPLGHGLLVPPDPYAVSGWDDVTGSPHQPWNPLGERPNRLFQYKLWEKNVAQLRSIGESATWLFYPILLAGVFLAASRADPAPHRPFWAVFAALVIYPLGYLFLHYEERFLYPVVMLLLVIATFAVDRAVKSQFWRGWGHGWLPMLIVGISFVYHPVVLLDQRWGVGRSIQTLADKLPGVIPPGAAVASDGHWSDGLYLSFHLGLRYYGHPKEGTPASGVEAAL